MAEWWDDLVPSTPDDDPVAPPFEPGGSAAPITDTPLELPGGAGASLPAAGVAEVTLGAAGEVLAVGESPVGLEAASGLSEGQTVRVEMLDQVVSTKAGVTGFAFRVSGSGGAALSTDRGSMPVTLSVDYSSLAGLFGAGFTDRLQVVALPECAFEDPVPVGCNVAGTPLATRNEAGGQRLLVDVENLVDVQSTPLAADLSVVDPTVVSTEDDVVGEPGVATSTTDTTVVSAAADEPAPTDDTASPSEQGSTTTSTVPPVPATTVPEAAPAPAAEAAGVVPEVGVAGGVVLAVTSGAEGQQGSFKATPLAMSGDWQVGVGSGEFSWGYDVPLPPAPAGAVPEVDLGYSSAAVDGMVTGRNNQASMAGLGWGDFADAFISRSYNSCRDDGIPSGDQCWRDDNATISLNGVSSELVPMPGTNYWKLKSDPLWLVEKLTLNNQVNGDDNGEYWRVRTPDGTTYWFGLGYNPDVGVSWVTGSTWTTLVVGDDQGEPCYNEGASQPGWCDQAWRWNLDRVEDPNGNVQEFEYAKEANRFTGAGGWAPNHPYVRSGHLTRITYGRRVPQSGSAVTGGYEAVRVIFDTGVRCGTLDAPGTTPCAEPTPNAPVSVYPDVPTDLLCTNSCTFGSATFFSTRRYTGVRTEAKTGSTWYPVDTVRLAHRFEDGDGDPATIDDIKLFLGGLQRTGQTGAAPHALPPTTFEPVSLNNRYNPPAGESAMPHTRIGSVTDEFGRQVNVTYGQPHPCDAPANPADAHWDLNTRDCFPILWAPDIDDPPDPVLTPFNKYVVTQVQVVDTTGGAPPMVTGYAYGDQIPGVSVDAAWHHDDDPFVPAENTSWSEWRGYQDVLVTQGTGATTTRVRSRVFTGMNGDVVEHPAPGNRTVSVSTLEAIPQSFPDDNWLAGRVLDEVTLRSDGSVERGSVHRYATHVTADAPDHCNGCPTDVADDARWVGENDTEVRVRRNVPGEVFATRRSQNLYDGFLRRTDVIEHGWSDQADDQRCTRTSYTPIDWGRWFYDYVSAVTRFSSSDCSGAPLARAETAYDNLAVGSTPVRGNPTVTRTQISSSPSPNGTWAETTTTFDLLGRPLNVTDARGNTTQTRYFPDATSASPGLLTKLEVTNPAGHKTITNFIDTSVVAGTTIPQADCAAVCTFGRQLPASTVDPNSKKTTNAYDPLGRMTGARLPTEAKTATATPPLSYVFGYDIDPSRAQVPVVNSRQLQDLNGTGGAARYLDSWVVYDALLRERQTHTLSPTGGKVIVTDTTYDDRGLAAAVSLPEAVTGTAGIGVLAAPASGWANHSRPTYDAVGRATEARFFAGAAQQWMTSTVYGHNTVEATPPPGGTRTLMVSDGLDRTVSVQEYDGAAWRSADYTYDAADRLLTVRDPASNTIAYTYDMAGRRLTTDDPDAGDWSYGYDEVGNRTRVTDAAGVQVHAVYDNLNRLTERRKDSTSGQLLARWFYDNGAGTTGGQLGMLDRTERYHATGTWKVDIMGYDARYRPTSRRWTVPAGVTGLTGNHEVHYAYDRADHVTTVGYPGVGGLTGEFVTTVYNSVGLPETMSSSESYVYSSTYDDRARPYLFGYGNSAAPAMGRFWGYDATQRPSAMVASATGGGIVQNRTIAYDPAGNVTERNTNLAGATARECFSYDQRARLTVAYTTTPSTTCASGANRGSGANPYNHTYAYSHDGNLLTRTADTTTTNYTYPTGGSGSTRPHAPTAVGTDEFDWNANGNLSERTISGQTETLAWDAEHNLTAIDDPDGDSSFVYDADGVRLLRESPGGRTLYIEGHEITVPAGGAATAVRTYAYGNGIAATRSTSGVDYLVTDNQGSVELSIPAGAATPDVVRTYLPYGERRSGGELDSDQAWIGEIEDDASGLQYLNARYFDPSIGVFTAPDPLYDPARVKTLNPFSYGMNNPATNGDPSGMEPCTYWPEGCGGGDGPPLSEEDWQIVDSFVSQGSGLSACGGHIQKFNDLALEDAYCDQFGAGGSTLDELNEFATEVDETSGPLDEAAMIFVEDWYDCIFEAGTGDPWNSNCGWAAVDLIPVGGKLDEAFAAYSAARRAGGSVDEGNAAARRILTGNACSFDADTDVLMADGSTKAISEVEVGDEVLATDPETDETGAREVAATLPHADQLLTLGTSAGDIITTEDHRYWNATDGEWQESQDLGSGDRLLAADGDIVTVEWLDWSTVHTAPAYDLTVAEFHSFYVGAGDEHILVHNCDVPFDSNNLGHIFRDASGHLADDTIANREIIQSAVAPQNLIGTGADGVSRYQLLLADGTQAWADVFNGQITNGGLNRVPR